MLTEITGDLLDVKHGIICHQTNYYGVMGAGIARSIADKILTREQYQSYVLFCRRYGRGALGQVQFLVCSNDLTVANLFCQDENKAYDGATSYPDMLKCLSQVHAVAQRLNLPVYFPYRIGCGIAGGNWDTVYRLISEVEEK